MAMKTGGRLGITSMSSARYKIMKSSGTFTARGISNKEKMPAALSKAYKARSELLANLKTIQPNIAAEIEKSDDINHAELNRTEEKLSRELIYVNRDCDRLSVKVDAELRGSEATTSDMHTDKVHNIDSFHNHLAEQLARAFQRRQEITTELNHIRERRDAPLIARMNAASELLKNGLDSYAAEVLLDLISSGFYGLELLISGDNDTVEICLRRIATVHGTAWLARLVASRPPAAANYLRLHELMQDFVS
jgi:hypothetical protein